MRWIRMESHWNKKLIYSVVARLISKRPISKGRRDPTVTLIIIIIIIYALWFESASVWTIGMLLRWLRVPEITSGIFWLRHSIWRRGYYRHSSLVCPCRQRSTSKHIGNENVPKIMINYTIIFFLLSILVISDHNSFRVMFDKIASPIRIESVPIQLAQCWFPGLAISNAKI